jgi:hypothetical protein
LRELDAGVGGSSRAVSIELSASCIAEGISARSRGAALGRALDREPTVERQQLGL